MRHPLYHRPRIRFVETPIEGAEVPPAGGTAPAPDDNAPAGDDGTSPTAGDAAPAADGEAADETDWRAKFEAQQKINRDLERKQRGEAGTLKAERDALKAKLEGREAEHADLVKQAAVEKAAVDKANARIVRAEVKALAAKKLADPGDALKFLDLDAFEVSADGDVDADAIAEAIEELVRTKPYLAAEGGITPAFTSPGSRRKEQAGQVTQAQLDRMTPDEINAARAAGRLDGLLGTTTK